MGLQAPLGPFGCELVSRRPVSTVLLESPLLYTCDPGFLFLALKSKTFPVLKNSQIIEAAPFSSYHYLDFCLLQIEGPALPF